MEEKVVLMLPAQREFLPVMRTALGGIALVGDLDVDGLDDLRQAADEACDLLMHQGAAAATLRLEAQLEGTRLCVSLAAALTGEGDAPAPEDLELSRAVLETLIPEVTLHLRPDGLVERIDLTVQRAVR